MKVVFVCTGNTCRSPMAEHLLRHRLEQKGVENIEVCSAGVSAGRGHPAAQQTIHVLEKKGIDSIHKHQSQPIEEIDFNSGDLILTMSRAHRKHLPSLPEDVQATTLKDYAGEGGSITDPFGGDLFVYEELYDELDPLIDEVAENIEK